MWRAALKYLLASYRQQQQVGVAGATASYEKTLTENCKRFENEMQSMLYIGTKDLAHYCRHSCPLPIKWTAKSVYWIGSLTFVTFNARHVLTRTPVSWVSWHKSELMHA